MMIRRLSALVCALLLWLPAAACGADGLQSLSYEEAVKKAAKENKYVLVDFYTDWCMPCKLQDKTTFRDPGVVKWLKDNAVAVKIDAGREVALAARMRINAYPTLVFLKADGTELERLPGYVDAERFLKIAASVKQGKTGLERITEELAADPNNVVVRMELAHTLGVKERYTEALREYLWCVDHGAQKEPEFAEFRNTMLLAEMAALGRYHAPALVELESRRADLDKRLLEENVSPEDFGLYVGLSRVLGKTDQALETYGKLIAKTPPAKRKEFVAAVFDLLLEAERYADIAAAMDLVAEVDDVLAMAKKTLASPDPQMKALEAGLSPEERTEMNRAQRQGLIVRAFAYYQVLVGVGRAAEAAAVAQKILVFDGGPDMYNALAWAGFLTGRPLPANLEQARRAFELSKGESVSIVDTLVRIMHVMGQTEQAIKTCREAIAKADGFRDRLMLEQCLAEITADHQRGADPKHGG